MPSSRTPLKIDSLTDQELQILQDASCGLTNKEIATAHGTNVNTLKSRLKILYRKLGLDPNEDRASGITIPAALAVATVLRAGKIRGPESSTPPAFTPTELDILRWVAYGYSSEKIGLRLSKSIDSIKCTLKEAGRKHGNGDRIYLMALAIVNGHI